MFRIQEAIVVEGRYDKNTLSQIVDTTVLTTGGFQIFNNREQLALIRRLAEQRGVILLLDSVELFAAEDSLAKADSAEWERLDVKAKFFRRKLQEDFKR